MYSTQGKIIIYCSRITISHSIPSTLEYYIFVEKSSIPWQSLTLSTWPYDAPKLAGLGEMMSMDEALVSEVGA